MAEKLDDVDPAFIAAWDQVTVAPDVSNTTVFNSGMWKAERELRPGGGQQEPNSTAGDNEQCKYAQKNPKKKKISETIKRPIPKRKPYWTRLVWKPSNVDSTTILDHQKAQVARTSKRPSTNRKEPMADQDITRPDTKIRAETEPSNGQGEGDTKWKGCLDIRLDLSV